MTTAVLNEICEREASELKSIEAAFQKLVIDVASNEVKSETALAILKSIGKSTQELAEAVSFYQDVRSACEQINAAKTDAETIPGLREQIRAAESELEAKRNEIITRCKPIHSRINEINEAQVNVAGVQSRLRARLDDQLQTQLDRSERDRRIDSAAIAAAAIGHRREQRLVVHDNSGWQQTK